MKISAPVAPHWDDQTQNLFFVNRKAVGNEPVIFRYDNREDALFGATIHSIDSVSFILPIESKTHDLFAIGTEQGVLIIRWNGRFGTAEVVNTFFKMDANIPGAITGYATSAPAKRFFGGTFFKQLCNTSMAGSSSFYRYDRPNGLTQLVNGLTYTGGIAFDENTHKNLNILYHLDVCQMKIAAFDHDPRTGDICMLFFVKRTPLPISPPFG